MDLLQLNKLFPEFDSLHKLYGSDKVTPIYGAGRISSPEICLVFMNPTSKNVSSNKDWQGIRAPWIGTKNIWRLLYKLNLFSNGDLMQKIESLRPEDWTTEFAKNLYSEIAKESLYITNIAKCTQDDARHVPDSVYRAHLPLMLQELDIVNPKITISFGNQVSSTLLSKQVSVSRYRGVDFEILNLPSGNTLRIYPSYYPIGQGTRNISLAISRINSIMAQKV